MDWFLYDAGLRHERVKPLISSVFNTAASRLKSEQKEMEKQVLKLNKYNMVY